MPLLSIPPSLHVLALKIIPFTVRIQVDQCRPEYHRVTLEWDDVKGGYVALSTGGQRSSRVLSLRSVDGLLCCPAIDDSHPLVNSKSKSIPKDSLVPTLLI